MASVWGITDDLPNSPNFVLPNFPAIWYIHVSTSYILITVLRMSLM